MSNTNALTVLLLVLRENSFFYFTVNLKSSDRRCRSVIFNVELSEDAWDQATLPVVNGGLRIRRVFNIAVHAFLSSVTGSHQLFTDLLPQYLHATSGTNDLLFAAALSYAIQRRSNVNFFADRLDAVFYL